MNALNNKREIMEESRFTMERFIWNYKRGITELYSRLNAKEQSKKYPQLRLKYMVDDYGDLFKSSKK